MYDEKQFWTAYRERKGYQISKNESRIASQYEDMILFMCDNLPLSYNEISSFGYRQFFRSLKTAQRIAKAKEDQANKLRRKK